MRVLLVEDEPNAAHLIAKGLREQTYAVDLATLGALTTTLADVLRDELSEEDDPSVAAGVVLDTVTAPGRALAILSDKAAVLSARWNGLEAGDLRQLVRGAPRAVTVDAPRGAWRVRTERMTSDSATMTLLVATPLADVAEPRAPG